MSNNTLKKVKLTTIEFVDRSIKTHGNKYDYSKTVYDGYDKNLVITCKIHGDFSQVARSHISGAKCPKCRKHVFNNETFIAKSKSIYGNKYEYLKDYFISSEENVKVVCKQHGVFKQKMDNHFRYDGCRKCKTQRKMISAAVACRDDKSSYNRRGYIEICRDNNGMSNLYVVEMEKDGELFYKVGITKRTLKERFRSNPYNIKEIKFITEEAGFIFDLEKQLHRILSSYQYRPILKFEGSTLECFSKIPKDIINLIDSMSKSNQLQLLA